MNKEQIDKFNKADRKIPNVYQFLIAKGVSADVADDAQEFLSNHWVDAIKDYDDILDGIIEDAAEDLREVKGIMAEHLQNFSNKWGDPNRGFDANDL